jgi:hypothetical protein
VKTAISIPDDVFRRVERQAKRLKVSRSEFFTRAAERLLATLAEEGVTRSYDEAFADDDDRATESFRRRATRAALLAVEWKE